MHIKCDLTSIPYAANVPRLISQLLKREAQWDRSRPPVRSKTAVTEVCGGKATPSSVSEVKVKGTAWNVVSD